MFIKKKCKNLSRKPILIKNIKKVESKKEERVVIETIEVSEPITTRKRSKKAIEAKAEMAENNNEKENFEENEF